jgi:hypothetical protein
MTTDVDDIRARHAARLGGQPPPPSTPTADEDLATLLARLQQCSDEVESLSAIGEDLRASSELWARLYEANLVRANNCEAERSQAAADLSRRASPSETLATLTGALEALVSTCEKCGRGRLPQPDEGLCRRCELAMDALRACHRL